MRLRAIPSVLASLAMIAGAIGSFPVSAAAEAQSDASQAQMRGRIPVEKDGARHREFLAERDRLIQSGGTDLIFVGDSITDWWRNDPQRDLFAANFAKYRPYNIGIAGDETQHVLWRIEHGELDGLTPKLVVLMIGTNNLANANRMNPAETADGVAAVVQAIRVRLPRSKILLLGIFPRANRSDDPLRIAVGETNAIIAGLEDRKTVFYLDLGTRFLEPDGTLPGELMPDYLHPDVAGYKIWADAIKPEVDRLTKAR